MVRSLTIPASAAAQIQDLEVRDARVPLYPRNALRDGCERDGEFETKLLQTAVLALGVGVVPCSD